MTAVCTFLAGFALAQSHARAFVAMLVALVCGWLLVLKIGPESKSRD